LSVEDRLQDTIQTLECIFRHDSNAVVFVIEGSRTFFNDLVDKFPTINYIYLESINPRVAEIVRTHKSKSHGENLMLLEFLRLHKSQVLENYDFLIKLSGRYYFCNEYMGDLVEKNSNKFLFKKPVSWNKQNLTYIAEYFLPHDMYINDVLSGYYTVAYSVGKSQINKYEMILNACTNMTSELSKYFYVDIEYLLYKAFVDLELKDDVVEIEWVIEGRGGQNGKYFRYE
jgi:hypothetical protein